VHEQPDKWLAGKIVSKVTYNALSRMLNLCYNCRGLAFRDVTVSIERLETTIMYHVGGYRETNTTVLKLQMFTP